VDDDDPTVLKFIELDLWYGRTTPMKKHLAAIAVLMMLGQTAFAVQLGSGAQVDEVDADGPAAGAGIKPGDIIRAIGGVPINGFSDIDPAVSAPGNRPLIVEIDRGGKHLRVKATPRLDPTGSHKTLGISHVEPGVAAKPSWTLVNSMFGDHSQSDPKSEPERQGPNDLYHIMFPDK
jgi:membrane-associated protease RseP (regulator of RpoE activity)